jgi:hypothetical protein
MKRSIIFIVMLVFGVLLCLKLFCSSGRYQIAFGNIQKEYRQCQRGAEDKTEIETIPVCFKIDTFTGRCWIYTDYTWITCTEKYEHDEGFKKIPKYKSELPH